MKRILLGCAVASLILPVWAQQPTRPNSEAIEKILEVGKTDNQVMHHLDVLTNRFGGRMVGSDAYENAADWLLDQYKQWGIKAWKEEAGQVPVGFNRGPWFGRLLGSNDDMILHFATPSYTSGTRGIQRGHVVREPQSEAELRRMKHKLKGAWVLLRGQKSSGFAIDKSAKGDSVREAVKAENKRIAATNDSIRRANWENGTQTPMLPLKEEPALFYKEMLDAGVLGFVRSSSLPIRALYDRPLVNDTNTNFYNLPEQAEVLLDEHQFEKIDQMARERQDILLEFDIRNHFKLGPIKYYSVVAEIPGTEFPDEYVIISGHLDAYDVATGGVDCGTGIGPMMEAARLLALSGAKPKRTIRFIAFAGEEFGLLGAQAYAKAHKDELKNISMLFNRDSGPLPPVGMRVPAAMVEDITFATEPIKRINPEYPFSVEVAKPSVRPTKFGGADHTVFAVSGVPVYSFMLDDFKGYDFNYGEIWHTERDVYNKEIPEYQEYTSVATALAALGIADLDHLLSREGMYIEQLPKAPAKGKNAAKKK